jgi:hypothetical protein
VVTSDPEKAKPEKLRISSCPIIEHVCLLLVVIAHFVGSTPAASSDLHSKLSSKGKLRLFGLSVGSL